MTLLDVPTAQTTIINSQLEELLKFPLARTMRKESSTNDWQAAKKILYI